MAFVDDLDHKFDEAAREKMQLHPDAKPMLFSEWPVRDLGRDEEIAGLREEVGIAPQCSLDERRIKDVSTEPGDYGYVVAVPLICDGGGPDAVLLELTRDAPHKVLRIPGEWLLDREL